MRSKLAIACLSVFLLAGWGRHKGTFNYLLDEGFNPADTALIIPATKDEKREPKANLAVRIFVNPAGRGSVAGLDSITQLDSSRSTAKLGGFNAVRVKPGVYAVNVSCFISGWVGFFSVTVAADPGQEYLVECLGNRAVSMKVDVFEK